MYLPNYGLRKTQLDKCLKCPVLGDSSRGNVANGLTPCCNERTFTIFINHCEGNCVGESLF